MNFTLCDLGGPQTTPPVKGGRCSRAILLSTRRTLLNCSFLLDSHRSNIITYD